VASDIEAQTNPEKVRPSGNNFWSLMLGLKERLLLQIRDQRFKLISIDIHDFVYTDAQKFTSELFFEFNLVSGY